MQPASDLEKELWIADLAELAEVEYSTSEMLWETFIRQLQVRLERGETVCVPAVGCFMAEKQEEYVAVFSEGTRRLIPPCIHLLLKPIADLYSPQISLIPNALSESTGFLPEAVWRWWNALGALLMQKLSDGLNVTWNGIGMFKPERDGQNVLCSFIFHPGGSVQGSLNKPFGMFRPVELSEEQVIADTTEVFCGYMADFTLHPASIIRVMEEQSSNTSVANDAEVIAELVPVTSIEPTPQEEFVGTASVAELQEEEKCEEAVPVEEAAIVESSAQKSFWPIVFVLFFLLLVAGTLYYWFAYHQSDVVRVCLRNRVEAPKVKVSVPQSTIEPQPKEVEPEPIARRKIALGDRLTDYAKEYYGHKVFWVYIYEENKAIVDNPNNIPIGLELVIPAAEKYQIDAQDNNSVKKALEKETQEYLAIARKGN